MTTAANSAFVKYRAGHCNFSCSNMASAVRARLILKSIALISSSHFLKALPPGRTSNKFPVLRKCKTLYAIIQPDIMFEELIHITSTEPYKSYGGMRMKEILIKPWENPDAKFHLEIWTDDRDDTPSQLWEVVCSGLKQTDGIPQAIISGTELKLFDNHPVLWHLDDEIYFSITSNSDSISSLMGDLFIEHKKTCGNWVDFHWLYSSLPETLSTLRENQLAIPVQLKDACFQVLEKYGVNYRVNAIQNNDKACQVLFFSKSENWPDEENFKQSYIIAETFSERRIS